MRYSVFASSLALVFFGASRVALAEPYFEEVPDPFGEQPCAGTNEGCFTNYLRMTDIDQDGDLDLLLPNADGYFEQGDPEPLVVYLNDGAGNFEDGSQAIVGGLTGYARQLAVGDVDGDLDVDLYVPAAWGDPDALFLNDDGAFVDHAQTHLPDLHSYAGATRLGDLDGDGDLDLLVTEGWATVASQPVHLYDNDGLGHFTERDSVPSEAREGEPIDLDLFDVDGDFDLDVLVDMHGAPALLWINDGFGNFSEAPYPSQGGLKYGPVACDVDGDGDLDVWTDNAGPSGREVLLINDGNGGFSDETAERVTGNVSGADDNLVACVDLDGDGDFDAAIGSLSDNERALMNDGTGQFTAEPNAFPSRVDGTLWMEFGDLDGDGRLDCATAQGETSFIDRVYRGAGSAPVDVREPILRAIEAPSEVTPDEPTVLRFAVSDNATTDEGPRLRRAWVRLTVNDLETEIDARFIGGDLYRAELDAATEGTVVRYVVCATDRQNNGACSSERSYQVGSNGAGGGGVGGSGAGGSDGAGAAGGGAGELDLEAEGDGCDCSVWRSRPGGRSGISSLSLLLLLVMRRRSQRIPRAE